MPIRQGNRIAVGILAGVLAIPLAAQACVEGDVRGEIVTGTREVGATPAGEAAHFNIYGAGWFRAVEITKLGGASDQTSVTLEIDGLQVFSSSFAVLKNPWMQLSTSFIVANVRTEGEASVMTVWYSPELKFRIAANLRVDVEEAGVQSVRVKTVMNKPAPHEHIPGQNPTAAALPAFK